MAGNEQPTEAKATLTTEEVLASLGAPRVALVGPKGSGKTIYRLYLHSDRNSLSDDFRRLLDLGSPVVGQETGEMLSRLGPDAYRWAPEEAKTLEPGEFTESYNYLRKVMGTSGITRHRLALPALGKRRPEEPAWALDFPGEYFARAESHELPVDKLLARCPLIIFMMPWWLLLPWDRCLRVPQGVRDVKLQLGGSDSAIVEAQQERHSVLVRTAMQWLTSMRAIMDPGEGAGRGPTLLVVFTMLGSDWWQHIQDAPPPEALPVLQRLTRARHWLEHPVAGGQDTRPRSLWDRPPLLQLRHVKVGTELGGLLAALHDDLREATHDAKRLFDPSDGARHVLEELCEICDQAGDHRVRFTAMNIVSDQNLFLAAGEQVCFRIELAGADFPSIYLAGSLDLVG